MTYASISFFEKKNPKTPAPHRSFIASSPIPRPGVGTAKRSPQMIIATKSALRILLGFWISLFGVNVSAQTPAVTGKTSTQVPTKMSMENLFRQFSDVAQKNPRYRKDFQLFLQSQPQIVVAGGAGGSNFISDFSGLPEPPDANLQSALNNLGAGSFPGVFTPYLLWLPNKNIGAVYIGQGSGACLNYVFFRTDGKKTVLIPTPSILQPGICEIEGGAAQTGGSEGLLVEYGGQVVTFVFEFDELPPFNQAGFDYALSWEVWTPAGWTDTQSIKSVAKFSAVSNDNQ